MIVLGGTFDPIHNGHLHCANAVADAFQDREIHLMLAARPNLKTSPVASVDERWQMLVHACETHPRLVPNDSEVHWEGESTTAATAQRLSANNDRTIVWIIGSDVASQLAKWKEFESLCEYVSFVVVNRPDYEPIQSLAGFKLVENPVDLELQAGRYYVLQEKMLSLSSSEIRRQAFSGMYINGLVPYSVYRFIRSRGLYLENHAVNTGT